MTSEASYQRTVYSTEQTLRAQLDMADATGIRTLDFFGSKLELPIIVRFADTASIQRYCDLVCKNEGMSEVFVKYKRGANFADFDRGTRILRVPDERWARSELVIIHELAHHGSTGGHGPDFQNVFVQLAFKYIGPEIGALLAAGFHMNAEDPSDPVQALEGAEAE